MNIHEKQVYNIHLEKEYSLFILSIYIHHKMMYNRTMERRSEAAGEIHQGGEAHDKQRV